ncbi:MULTISPECIES: MBL fold metallo-hydrolase [Lachnospiraceae]|uniref:MBL fold metallo-hydrolase n=1 Tax=Faecalicatena acetigenes TaxID=2981790 RepID=A0ABT2TA89_9FIRM|nr:MULTISPECIES: MBL fold metallo-hydrolase [Lachnospiraceae]MCU6746787.1 MBL fold metallo-hydrolase [Faecalicatena acetigenes]SCH41705.1 metal-dependent hydrolase [uncultured Clostridium sp.]
MMKVLYLAHSGFLVEMETAYFLFDYYKGELPKIDTKKEFYVFASHAHYDHFQKEIFILQETIPKIQYILSADIQVNEKGNILFVNPGEQRRIGRLRIETLRSTDEGVAFLLHYAGKTIYHAGDLNWWHWEGETQKYNTQMRRSYQQEINKLQKEKIDVAFVPVDPRLGEQYCLGLDCFMKRTDTKVVFPMHFWEKYDIFHRLSLEQCTKEYLDKIQIIEKEGQIFSLE